MSLKRTVQYWRIGFIAISIMILLSVSGCSDTHLEDEQVVERARVAVEIALMKHKALGVPNVSYDRKTQRVVQRKRRKIS